MKSIKDFILEGKKHVDQTTIGDFVKWYCLDERSDGKKCKVTADDVQGLIDNGWFDNFGDDDNSAKQAADFINKNWDENIKVTSEETPNDWEISFTFDGEEYLVGAISYFGDDIEY